VKLSTKNEAIPGFAQVRGAIATSFNQIGIDDEDRLRPGLSSDINLGLSMCF
jgi:hypothetical protein